jgi:hypothetical protein
MDNEELAELPAVARLLFIYLWMLADREGRLEDRPKRIAAQALPYDRDADIEAILNGLHERGFITRYETAGVKCIQITAFTKHQTPHVREAASELPAPEQGIAKEVTKHNLGSAEASPRSPDSLIPDSLIPDSGQKTSAPRKRDAPLVKPDDVSDQVWSDYCKHRKRKRADLSASSLEDLIKDASKAGMPLEDAMRMCMKRGWTGFEAHWLKPEAQLREPSREKRGASDGTTHVPTTL